MLDKSAIYQISVKLFIEMEHHIVAHNSRGCLTDPTVNYGHIHI